MELIKWTLMEEKEESSGAVPATIAVTSDTPWSTRFAIYGVKCRTEYTFDCFTDNLL